MFNHLSDREVSLTGTTSLLLWLLGFGLVVAHAATALDVGPLGIFFVALAAVLTVRGYIRCGVDQVNGREMAAFDLGRESAEVRSLR